MFFPGEPFISILEISFLMRKNKDTKFLSSSWESEAQWSLKQSSGIKKWKNGRKGKGNERRAIDFILHSLLKLLVWAPLLSA